MNEFVKHRFCLPRISAEYIFVIRFAVGRAELLAQFFSATARRRCGDNQG